MRIAELARLRSILLEMTLAQRDHLKVIVECHSQQLSVPVCESLVDLGLTRAEGNKFIATEDGRYVASLL